MFFLFCFVAAAVFFIWCYFSIDASLTLFAYNKFLYERRQKLQGKTIWITGASSGIGECVTYELASLGAKLILSARRKGELERVKEACIGATIWCHCGLIFRPVTPPCGVIRKRGSGNEWCIGAAWATWLMNSINLTSGFLY
eukprot:m.16866 g.16866  ORF g.16866 m.16866 type:complete len:142 (+) comp27178_c0_seq3:155-580(+)